MDVKFVINTCKGFSDESVPILIQSLLKNNINNQAIVIIEGGHDERKQTEKYGCLCIETDNNSFDLTAMIDIAEHQIKSDYWFYLHDTVIVGNKFKPLLEDKLSKLKSLPDAVALYFNGMNGSSMNMGLYKYDYIASKKDLLLSRKNKNYTKDGLKEYKIQAINDEDLLLWQSEIRSSLSYFCRPEKRKSPPDNFESLNDIEGVNLDVVNNEPLNNEPLFKPYKNSKAERLMEHYEDIDLYKFKSNFGANNPEGKAEMMVITL